MRMGTIGIARCASRMRHGRLTTLALLALLGACGGGGSDGSSTVVIPTPTPSPSPTPTPGPTPTPTPSTGCALYPAAERGLYAADGTNATSGATGNVLTANGIERTDVRGPLLSGGGTATGVPVRLTLTLVNSERDCAPLSGYAVYIWQADGAGRYSLYDAPLESYLRGLQVTDAQGRVTFTTIIPGVESGRYPHLHVEIFRSRASAGSGSNAFFISQIAIPRAAAQAAYADVANYPGAAGRLVATPIEADPVFASKDDAARAAMTLAMEGGEATGFTGSLTLALTVPPGI